MNVYHMAALESRAGGQLVQAKQFNTTLSNDGRYERVSCCRHWNLGYRKLAMSGLKLLVLMEQDRYGSSSSIIHTQVCD